MERFPLSSDQCELLAALESAGSVKALALQLGRDESVISRQIKAIAETAPVLSKIDKRWTLTPVGKNLTKWSRDAINGQKALLRAQTTLKIATTREFSAKVLIPNLALLIGSEAVSLSILTSDSGIENELLAGRADIGIDCGRPEDPLVKFKFTLPEPYLVVASPAFLQRHSVRDRQDLLRSPHLKFARDSAVKLLELKTELPNIFGSFNDLGSVRAACVAGYGWATLPRYVVQSEIKQGLLKSLPSWKIQPRSFGVWWIRGRPSCESWVDRTTEWLSKQKV